MDKNKEVFKKQNSALKSSLRLKKINKKNSISPVNKILIKRGKSLNIIINRNFKKLQINNNKLNSVIYHDNKSEYLQKPLFPPKKKNSLSKNHIIIIENQSKNQLLYLNNLSKSSISKKSSNNILRKAKSSKCIKENKNKIIFNFNNEKSKFIDLNEKSKENKLFVKNKYNDEELNTLEYKIAIIVDKRTYFQYYWSLIKKKQLFLFTFISANDYNLIQIKICLLLLAFSLYFTINGFFFTDETMNNIYEDKGYYNIIYHIPQILYSTLISVIVNTIFKSLSLSENQLLSIKKEKNIHKAKIITSKIRKILRIKLILFYIIGSLFLLFF